MLYFALKEMTERNQGQSKKKVKKKRERTNEQKWKGVFYFVWREVTARNKGQRHVESKKGGESERRLRNDDTGMFYFVLKEMQYILLCLLMKFTVPE